MEAVSRLVERRAESAQADLAKFAARLAEDPCSALTWSEGAFKAAAALKVCAEARRWLEVAAAGTSDKVTPETVVGMLAAQFTADALRAARHPERSTSVQSNLVGQEVAAAKAEFVDSLSWA